MWYNLISGKNIQGGVSMHLQLDYTMSLSERLNYAHTLPLDQCSPSELELVANYILYKDKSTPKAESKFTHSKTVSLGTVEQENQLTGTYTKPKPVLHKEDPYIQQYLEAIDSLNEHLHTNKETVDNTSAWKLRRWKLEHNLDMGTANAILYPTLSLRPTYSPSPELDIDEIIDLTNSFHISKLIEFYSQLRQSDSSKIWVEWIEDNIIEKTPMYPWQKHLLMRRIDGTKQVTIGRELGEFFGKIVSPSTMSQTMRSLYRQIAITAEKELFAYHNRNNPTAWRICKHCGEKKLVKFDFYESKPHICKQCGKKK